MNLNALPAETAPDTTESKQHFLGNREEAKRFTIPIEKKTKTKPTSFLDFSCLKRMACFMFSLWLALYKFSWPFKFFNEWIFFFSDSVSQHLGKTAGKKGQFKIKSRWIIWLAWVLSTWFKNIFDKLPSQIPFPQTGCLVEETLSLTFNNVRPSNSVEHTA